MGYLGVYIWRRSAVLDMILGDMLEELSSVTPTTRLGLDNERFQTPGYPAKSPHSTAAKKLLRLSIAT